MPPFRAMPPEPAVIETLPLPALVTSPVIVTAADPLPACVNEEPDSIVRVWKAKLPVPLPLLLLPVELPEVSAVRHAFTHTILGKDMDALKSFWQQSIFSGRAVPPPERDSDADVLDYIRKYPGAIGYVSASTPLSADVKVVTVR